MPTPVIDASTGQPVDLPESEVADAWRAGKIDLIGGTTHHVRMPDGRLMAVPSESLHTALGNGGQILSPGELEQRQAERDYGGVGGAAIAGIGGAAEQATMGAAPYLMPASVKKAVEQSEAAHPYVHGAGEIAGALGLSAVLPGGGLAGLAERGGAAIVEGAGASLASQVSRRALAAGIKSAVEGAQYGASASIAQSGLDPEKHPLTAEHIIADMGANALWGGVLGGGLGAAGGLLGSFARRAAPVAETASRVAPVDEAGVAKKMGGAFGDLYERADVPIGDIQGNTAPWSDEKMAALRQQMAGGGAIDPIQLDRTDAGAWNVNDGIHRVNVAKEMGYDRIPAYVPKGTAGKLATALGDTADITDADVGKVAGRVLGVDPHDGLGAQARSFYSKLSGMASGKDPDKIASFAGGLLDEDSLAYKNRASLIDADEQRAAAALDTRDHLDSFLDAERAMTQDGGGGALKRSNLKGLTADVDPVRAAQDSRNAADLTVQRLQEMAQDVDTYGGEKPIASAMKFAGTISRKLDVAIAGNDVAEQYALIDELKRGVGKYTKGATALNPRAATDELVALQGKARAAKLQDLYDDLKGQLENENVWGQAGEAQKAVNEAWTKQIDASGRFKKALTTNYARDPENPWVTKTIVDPEKVQGYLNGLNDPAKDLTHQSVRDYLESSQSLSRAMAEHWELPAKQLAATKTLTDSAAKLSKTLEDTSQRMALVNQFQELRAHTTGHGTALGWGLGALAGGHLGGPVGALSGGILGKTLGYVSKTLTDPYDTLMKVARVEAMVRRGEGRIARSVRGLVRGSQAASRSPELSSFARKAAQVKLMSSDPAFALGRVTSSVAPLAQVHPELGKQVQTTTLAGLAFLRGKLPPEPPLNPMSPHDPQPLPSPGQRESFLRYYKAVNDPLSVVEDLRAGKMSLEGSEALREVYPQLYSRVQAAVSDSLATRREPMSYQSQLGLSMMLGLPAPSTDPSYIATRQAAFAAPPPDQPPAPKPGGKGNRSKPMNLTSQLSPSQKVETGHDASSP